MLIETPSALLRRIFEEESLNYEVVVSKKLWSDVPSVGKVNNIPDNAFDIVILLFLANWILIL